METAERPIREGCQRSEGIIHALLKVPRDDFILETYRDYAARAV